MKTIVEYLINNHVNNSKQIKQINSSADLEEGDYYRVEWVFDNYNYWLIGKFNRIDLYNNTCICKSVIYDFCISHAIKNIETQIQINGHTGLEHGQKDIQLTYKTPTPKDVELLDEVEHYIQTHKLTKYIGDGKTKTIGIYTNKIHWHI